jgi:hypothetical protein
MAKAPTAKAPRSLTARAASAASGASAASTANTTAADTHATNAKTARHKIQNDPHQLKEDACHHCTQDLAHAERALFVEEEIGRVFCSEGCIATFFAPEIERLEKEYHRRTAPGDLTGSERESLAHLRWITLQEPDEVWREKTLSGDFRYTMISEFEPGKKPVWSICICLFLRGEPSFLYIAFSTKNAAMANSYRRGERMQWDKNRSSKALASGLARENAKASKAKGKSGKGKASKAEAAMQASPETGESAEKSAIAQGDRLADAWTENETFQAQINQERRGDDIPPEEYELYQACIEETLETPDEVWSVEMADPEGLNLYHFIRHYPDAEPGHWYIIMARETEEEEQIEIIDAFPTRDAALVERYRRGKQEVGETTEQSRPTSRLVH